MFNFKETTMATIHEFSHYEATEKKANERKKATKPDEGTATAEEKSNKNK